MILHMIPGSRTRWQTFVPAQSHARELAWLLTIALSILFALVLALVGPLLVGAAIGAFVVLIVLLRYPWLGVLLLVASVPAQDFGALQIGGQSLTLTRAMFPLALLGYLIALIVGAERVRGSRVLVPYLVFVSIVVISSASASSMAAVGSEIGRWLTAFIAFVVLLHFLIDSSRKRLLALVSVMALGGVFQATYGVTQSIFAIGPDSFRVGDEGSRAFGTFGQPNSYAGYLEMVLFPVFWVGVYVAGRSIAKVRQYQRARLDGYHQSIAVRRETVLTALLCVFLLGSAVLILGGIVASYSRGAWLGIAAGGTLSALLFHGWIRRAAILLAPLAVLVLLGGASSVLPEALQERVTTGFADIRPFDASNITITSDNFAAAERMAHWQAGWRMFADEPVSGVGAGNFNELYPEYFVREQFQFSRGHAHNFYIHLLAEVGLPGLAASLVLAVSFLYLALLIVLKAPRGFERMLALGMFGTIVSVSVHNVFENLHVLNLSIQMGAIWALTIAAHRRWHRTMQEPLGEPTT